MELTHPQNHNAGRYRTEQHTLIRSFQRVACIEKITFPFPELFHFLECVRQTFPGKKSNKLQRTYLKLQRIKNEQRTSEVFSPPNNPLTGPIRSPPDRTGRRVRQHRHSKAPIQTADTIGFQNLSHGIHASRVMSGSNGSLDHQSLTNLQSAMRM